MNTDLSEIKEIENLIINNKLEEAILKMKLVFEEINDESLINESLLLLSRMNNFQSKANNGVIDYFAPEFGKIRFSTITLKTSVKSALKSANKSTKTSTDRIAKDVMFEEHFLDNRNDWKIGKKENCYEAIIRDGRYFIDRLNAVIGAPSFSQILKLNESKDFIIKARLQFLGGSESESFGLDWGESIDSQSSFRFTITANGSFYIVYFIDGEAINITDHIANPIIKKGKKVNLLEIEKNKDLLHFKINNEVVYTNEYISFFGSKIGFHLNRNVKIAIGFFQVIN